MRVAYPEPAHENLHCPGRNASDATRGVPAEMRAYRPFASLIAETRAGTTCWASPMIA
jgi:hypothetical protein